MRWDSLFDDLEGQLDSAWDREDLERRAEDERLRIGRLGMRDRLIALGTPRAQTPRDDAGLRVNLRCGRSLSIVPRTYGRDWLAADLIRAHGGAGACILALDGITSVAVRPDQVEQSIAELETQAHNPQITDRIGLPFVLRDLCRRRSYVSLTMSVSDAAIGGTIDRVARDHLDLARHEHGSPRSARDVTTVQLIALAQLDLVEL